MRALISIFVILCFLSADAFAQKKKKRRRVRDSGQAAVVLVDGSAVYEKPNFDSPVMDYLDKGKKVRVSKRVYKGIGGLGAFFKVRLRRKVYGYITDVDISISGKSGMEESKRQNAQKLNDPTQIQEDLEDPLHDDPTPDNVYFSKFIGGGYTIYNYAEEIAGKKRSSDLGMFAFRYTGPGEVFAGLPIDYEVAFSTDAPDFYDRFSTKASGFMMIAHALGIMPVWVSRDENQMAYYALGLTFRYSKFDVSSASVVGSSIDSQEATIGAAGSIGYAIRFAKKFAFRADFRYVYEAEGYTGYGGALQYKY